MRYLLKQKLGALVRGVNTGLGNLAWEFYEHFDMKVLIVENPGLTMHPERFNQTKYYREEDITNEILENFLSDIDILLIFQNPLIRRVIPMAKEKGKKICWITMYECMPATSKYYQYSDIFICPSELDYREFSFDNKVLLSIPVNHNKIVYKERSIAQKFLHIVGWPSAIQRNGTLEVLKAVPFVKGSFKLTLNIQDFYDFKVELDLRVVVQVQDITNYWEVFGNHDVLVFPITYGAISMPIMEALASGMPVIGPNLFPFNTYLDEKFLIEPNKIWHDDQRTSLTLEADQVEEEYSNRSILKILISPQKIADKISEVLNTDLIQSSRMSYDISRQFAWDTLGPRYAYIFNQL